MAQAKAKAKKKPDGWVEHAAIVRKTHPNARSGKQAVHVARYHTGRGSIGIDERPSSWKILHRPTGCFAEFRGQKQGPHVTIVWGRLKKSAGRRRRCR
jgi:hypothetical protein